MIDSTLRALVCNVVWSLACASALVACAAPAATFESPEAALQALVESAEDPELAQELLGPGNFELLWSGDEATDREDLEAVRELIREQVVFQTAEDGARIALLGEDEWPLPLPIVRAGSGWRFDVEAGLEEILIRRIGRNELATIDTLRACVEAQYEYAAESRDGNPRAFAAKFASAEGLHDGLYWPTEPDEPESPLGPLLAQAAASGYQLSELRSVPYQGYHFRMLTAQGESASGGAYAYTDENGHLSRGFAILAWPATYDNSGIMTFVVNQLGIVFERDFGPDTTEAVAEIDAYDPDANWSPVVD
jgi:hypothetical protein